MFDKFFPSIRRNNKFFLAMLVFLSLAAWCVAYSTDLVLVYNDSMSHLNMARLAIDNQKPGIAQIGSVWLPLNHVLELPLIWNGWAWHSGFAGSLVSMVSFVAMTVAVYFIVMELIKDRLAALIGAIAAAFNLNMLYLQTTPLTEPLYLALFALSVFYLLRYLRTGSTLHLLLLALFASLQIMTRYDGWFVAAVIAGTILAHELRVVRQPFDKAFGKMLLFVVPVAFAVLVWVGWNALIFDNPLYFATGEFSAQAQQDLIDEQTGLSTKGNVGLSLRVFGHAVAENVGWLMINVALVGWLLYLNPRRRHEDSLRLIVFVVLISAVIFNVIALILGFSSMNMPELGWVSGPDAPRQLFNVRYGILALPFAAVGAGLLVRRWKYFAPIILAVLMVQGAIMFREQPIALRDGRIGASAFVERDIAQQIKANVGPGDDVLMSMSNFNPVAFASGLELKRYIHEGTTRTWNEAIDTPQTRAEWIVMANDGNTADPVYDKLVVERVGDFEKHYTLVYRDQHARLYQLKEMAVVAK